MNNSKKVNLSSLNEKLPKAAFGLFRYWINKAELSDKISIKNERSLVQDLKDTLSKALNSLFKKEDLKDKPPGWDIGFIIGFVNGNLGESWHHQYIAKNSEDYKVFAGLKAIEGYLQFDELARLRINELYRHFLEEDSNVNNIEIEITKNYFEERKFKIYKTSETGKILTIVNNLILRKILEISNTTTEVDLPIRDYFSSQDIKKLIEDNKIKL